MAGYRYWMPYYQIGLGNRKVEVNINEEHGLYQLVFIGMGKTPVIKVLDNKQALFEFVGQQLGIWAERLVREADRIRQPIDPDATASSASGATGDGAGSGATHRHSDLT